MFDYDFVSLGGYVLDLYIPVPEFPVEADRTYRVLGKTVEQEAGGSVGNITIMASRLGLKTTTVAYLGQDPYGRHIHDTLQAEGVDVGYLEFREDLYTPLVVVLSDAKGKHSYVTNLSHGNIREFPTPGRRPSNAPACFTSAAIRCWMKALRTTFWRSWICQGERSKGAL